MSRLNITVRMADARAGLEVAVAKAAIAELGAMLGDPFSWCWYVAAAADIREPPGVIDVCASYVTAADLARL